MAKSEKLTGSEGPTEHRLAMRELEIQIASNRSLIAVMTPEERRVLDAIHIICVREEGPQWALATWDVAAGVLPHTDFEPLPEKPIYNQKAILQWFNKQEPTGGQRMVLVLKDFFKFFGDGREDQLEREVIRELRNLAQDSIGKNKHVILMGTDLKLPRELEKLCAVIDWPLPEREHIEGKVKSLLEKAGKSAAVKKRFQLAYSIEEMDDIVSAFQGLTIMEIELIISYGILTGSKLEPTAIARKKRDTIRKAGLLEWREVSEDLDSIGGLHELKKWLSKRRGAFGIEAQNYGLPHNPKGLLLVGVQGAGKSLAAQAIASYWQLPLLRLDMGRVFGGVVGQSESNIRAVFRIAESVAPCVLWCDEMEKGMSGTASSNHTDGGTASRVFGTILTWMQEKTKSVYIVATANDVSQMPPELLRKGRFDEIFFVDLPSEEDRAEILRIHLKKRNLDVQNFDIPRLVSLSKSCTGAEIEAAIISAMYDSFDDGARPLETRDVAEAILETVPLAVTMKERIEELRLWATTRARNASVPRKGHASEEVQVKETKHSLMADIDTDEEL